MHIPYHQAAIGPEEEAAALRVLRSGWLTAGAESAAFAQEFCAYKGGGYAHAVTSCTAGLSLLLASLQLPPGSEVIVPPITFVSTAHVVLQNGLVPVFADVSPGTLLLDPTATEAAITPRTRAIIPVHVGGHACDMATLCALAERHSLIIIEDCAHALESTYRGQAVGSFGYGSSFSFYANKNITTGEGGMVWVPDADIHRTLAMWRNHGLDYDAYARRQSQPEKPAFLQYDILLPGYKYALPDLPAAIGRAQLAKVADMHQRRQAIAQQYLAALADCPALRPLLPATDTVSAWHLFIVALDAARLDCTREQIMCEIMARGVELSLHFKPIPLLSAYAHEPHAPIPHAMDMYARIFSLPMYPLLNEAQVGYVAEQVATVVSAHLR